jgi:hypothetical protein
MEEAIGAMAQAQCLRRLSETPDHRVWESATPLDEIKVANRIASCRPAKTSVDRSRHTLGLLGCRAVSTCRVVRSQRGLASVKDVGLLKEMYMAGCSLHPVNNSEMSLSKRMDICPVCEACRIKNRR